MPTKKRSESFFGLHFDFHSRGILPVGENLRRDIVSKLLDEVKPDYVQVDTKGHPGFSSYPTKSGNPAPDMRGDQLMMWRELTAERGIALYGHHSGLYDMKVAADHPHWAVIDENGAVSREYLSVFGDYSDEFLIPQLLELALDYKLDGVWVDGECWGTKLDYSAAAKREWKKISDIEPPKPGDKNFGEYLEFIRTGFRAYVTHYINTVKAKAPDFQITSNWMYSIYMPEKPEVPIDFVSGDYSPQNSVNSARICGRFTANQGLPWDMMAWGHNSAGAWTTSNRSTKEYIQYCQEAAYIIALGGGFQFYNIQYNEGSSVQEWAIPLWKNVASFVREREPFCRGASLLPQVGIFMPSESHTADLNIPFSSGSGSMNSAKGLVHLSQDCGYSSEILETHNLLSRDLSEFGVILLGKASRVDNESIEHLLEYVRDGGSLLAASPEAARLFGFDMTDARDRMIHICEENTLAPIQILTGDFKNSDANEVCGYYYNDNCMSDGPYPAAIEKKVGKGRIIATCFDLGSAYPNNRTGCVKNFYKSKMTKLFKKPLATISGSEYAELVLTRRSDSIFAHLLNHAGEHEVPGVRSYSEIPKLGPITLKLRNDINPDEIYIEPGHIKWEGDAKEIVIDKLEVHTIIEIKTKRTSTFVRQKL